MIFTRGRRTQSRLVIMVGSSVLTATLVAGCSGPSSAPNPSTRTAESSPSAAHVSPATTPSASPTPASTPTPTVWPTGAPEATELVTGITSPWGLAFFSDGTALVAERDTGKILWIVDGGTSVVGEITDVQPSSEGGLLGLAIAPDDQTVFAYYSAESDNRVISMSWDGERLRDQNPILEGIPESGRHNGGQLAIGPDGYLYVATGDATEPQNSQDEESLAGKILRVELDGSPAPGNPFNNEVYSLGHRNVQGLAFDDQDQLWASEFGDQQWDELNKITSGGNYGWPEAEGSANLDGRIDPVVVWKTSEASPSGLEFWQGSLWMAGLRGQRLWEIPLTDGEAGEPRAYFTEEYGRLRSVRAEPSGEFLWLGTSNTDGRNQPNPGDDRLLVLSRD